MTRYVRSVAINWIVLLGLSVLADCVGAGTGGSVLMGGGAAGTTGTTTSMMTTSSADKIAD